MELIFRKATTKDLLYIINLLIDDDLAKTREAENKALDLRYLQAFNKINIDPNQHLMVVEYNLAIIGTCHLTIMPSLTFIGSNRMQIEMVRIARQYREQKIGKWMLQQCKEIGQSFNVKLMQLTTNKKRSEAKKFYKHFGFKATHIGMKLAL